MATMSASKKSNSISEKVQYSCSFKKFLMIAVVMMMMMMMMIVVCTLVIF